MVYLPQTLHGRLYLLSYDRERHRFDDQDMLFTFALRAAMLTDLYLTGYMTDEGGWAYVSDAARPDDPVLDAACDQIKGAALMDWDELIAVGEWAARDAVRDQLGAAGWLPSTPRRVLGIIPPSRVRLYDVDLVRGLADQVTEALRNAIDGRPAEPRLLAVGLLGVLGQMPTVLSFKECSQHPEVARDDLMYYSPILALHKTIQLSR
jgi:hypothetical protein